MNRLAVTTASGSYPVIIDQLEKTLPPFLEGKQTVIVSDEHVISLHGERFSSGLPLLTIGRGEAHKTQETVSRLHRELLALGCDRGTLLLGLGGGIVCDVTAYTAATFMRGCACGLIPTTLLAQVDAAVGGKCGVNLDGFKNIVGVFRQPAFVLCDPEFLDTLPLAELACGLAESVKHAAIADSGFWTYLEEERAAIAARRPEALRQVVERSLAVKIAIVSRDETEQGERRLLNFGHTFAHALEKLGSFTHGEAVSCGMVQAALLSQKLGLLQLDEVERLARLLGGFGLPVRSPLPAARLLSAMEKDKKKAGTMLNVILLAGFGRAVERPMTFDRLRELLHDLPDSV